MFRAAQLVAGVGVVGGLAAPLVLQRLSPTTLDGSTSLFHSFDPESAHSWAIYLTRKGLSPTDSAPDAPSLQTSLWGQDVKNCVGLAAGFDKNGEAVPGLNRLGFGLVEIGSVTPQPQPGNDKPRVFRLTEDKAVINRYGFNSGGIIAARSNLRRYRAGLHGDGDPTAPNWERFAPSPSNSDQVLLGVNLGKNKEPKVDAAHDYVAGVFSLGPYADYLVVNVSSPNTPGLRNLQASEHLGPLLEVVIRARDKIVTDGKTRHGKLPLLVKIAPDLTDDDAKDIATTAVECGVDGIIISNTTIARDGLTSEHKDEMGGMSGAPLFDKSTSLLRTLYAHTRGAVPLIGVGGISNGAQAYEKIRAGASAVQVYSALVYEGPGLVRRIKDELAGLLEKDGIAHVNDAVGLDVPLDGKKP